MISLNNIHKVFNAGKPSEFLAVRGVSLDIEQHRVTLLRGPSGSGKTTLLSILGCMTRPTSGRILFNDREITSLPERFLSQIRQNSFGFIFQQFNLIKGMTALENVMLPAYPAGERYEVIRARALELLSTFELAVKAEARVEWLSGGQAQRVAIARALINSPEVIISDEPTAHLDTGLSREFMRIIQALNSEGRTVLIASHDPIVNESTVVHTVFDMRDGQITSSERRR